MKNKRAAQLEVGQHFLAALRRVPARVLVNPSVRQNMLLLLANVLAGGFAYLLHPLLGRLMSIQAYGEVATFISVALVLSTLTQTIATIAAKYTSALVANAEYARLARFVRLCTLLLLLAGMAATLLFALWGTPLASFFHLTSRQEIVILSLICVPLFTLPLNQGMLQGLQLFGWYALLTLFLAALRLVCALALVLAGLGVSGAIWGIVLSMLGTYLLSFWPLRQLFGKQKWRGSWALSLNRAALLSFLVTGVVSLGVVVLSSLDTILARHFLSPAETGLYAALATIGRTTLFLTNGIAIIMFPKMVVRYERGEPHTRLALQVMLSVVALAAGAQLFFCLVPELLTRLLFGAKFLAIADLLPLYGLAMLLLACTQTLALYFLAVGRRAFALAIVGACVLEIMLIAGRHTDIAYIVQDVLLANLALLLVLVLCWQRIWQKERIQGIRQGGV